MNLTCAVCGERGTAATMVRSRHSRNAYCRDTTACAIRQGETLAARILTADKRPQLRAV